MKKDILEILDRIALIVDKLETVAARLDSAAGSFMNGMKAHLDAGSL